MGKSLKILLVACLWSGAVLAQEQDRLAPLLSAVQKVPLVTKKLILRALDKVTGRVQMLEATLGEEMHFGKLRITPRQCRKSLPEDPPESVAFLEIQEERDAQKRVSVFEGWMFASNPSVSAMEHPVYDVWLVECTGAHLQDDKDRSVFVHRLNTQNGLQVEQDASMPSSVSSSSTFSPSEFDTGPKAPEETRDTQNDFPTKEQEKAQLEAFHRGLNAGQDFSQTRDPLLTRARE
jgi:hypothetical protein